MVLLCIASIPNSLDNDTVLGKQNQKDTQKLRNHTKLLSRNHTDFYLASGTSQQRVPCTSNFTINGGGSGYRSRYFDPGNQTQKDT